MTRRSEKEDGHWSQETVTPTGSKDRVWWVQPQGLDWWDDTWVNAGWMISTDTALGRGAHWAWNHGQEVAQIGFGVFDVVAGAGMIWTGVGTAPGWVLIAVGIDQIAAGSMKLRYGRASQSFSLIENGTYLATGSETAAILAPGAISLIAGSAGGFGRLGVRAGAAGGGAAVGAGLTEFRVGSTLLREGGWVDRWARFWRYEKDAQTVWAQQPTSVLGGLWQVGRVEELILKDARYSVAWFDALAHEGVHIISGILFWPLKSFVNNTLPGRFFFGWTRFAEEFAAYNVGRAVVGRVHGMGPFAIPGTLRSLREGKAIFAVTSATYALPGEIALGYFLYQKFRPLR